MMSDEVTSSGHVECSECGHVIENHDTRGCQIVEGCTCRNRWTIAQIKSCRTVLGLPAEWREWA
jgi:hypothetical protein